MTIQDRFTRRDETEVRELDARIERLFTLAMTKETEGKPDLADAALRLAIIAETRRASLQRT